ncbi:hypothetical protein WN55_09124 [Dufourea novaeangliae]|uniref:Uncharacterized protein n=1 Tax=Dufourea novaeangliae TaxID=178035 RepID=A0A154P889_DUFNO|nr:hypothetical protein WN55_09124 [Dufourea novaeangliae]
MDEETMWKDFYHKIVEEKETKEKEEQEKSEHEIRLLISLGNTLIYFLTFRQLTLIANECVHVGSVELVPRDDTFPMDQQQVGVVMCVIKAEREFLVSISTKRPAWKSSRGLDYRRVDQSVSEYVVTCKLSNIEINIMRIKSVRIRFETAEITEGRVCLTSLQTLCLMLTDNTPVSNTVKFK